jgi:dihydropyrimidine dehydrogenase (NAD+) subunit PreT
VKLLGAETVTMAYRRGVDQMGATKVEQEWAQTHGVTIRHWLAPLSIAAGPGGQVEAVLCAKTRLDAGRLQVSDERVTLPADLVLKAVGQSFRPAPLAAGTAPDLSTKRIAIGEGYQTSLSGVFAGGDCVSAGEDLTVQAVAHGRDAAIAINRFLSA